MNGKYGLIPRNLLRMRLNASEVGSMIMGPAAAHRAVQAIRNHLPNALRLELGQIAALSTAGIEPVDALLVSLQYEGIGFGCTTAALPELTGHEEYRMLRILDWYAPEPLKAQMKWARITPKVQMRVVPGYVGAHAIAVDSDVDGGYAMAVNQPPDAFHNLPGEPITWAIRRVACEQNSLAGALAALMQLKPMRGAYITLVGKKKAYWLSLNQSTGNKIVCQVDWPNPLVVGNCLTSNVESWKYYEMVRWYVGDGAAERMGAVTDAQVQMRALLPDSLCHFGTLDVVNAIGEGNGWRVA